MADLSKVFVDLLSRARSLRAKADRLRINAAGCDEQAALYRSEAEAVDADALSYEEAALKTQVK